MFTSATDNIQSRMRRQNRNRHHDCKVFLCRLRHWESFHDEDFIICLQTSSKRLSERVPHMRSKSIKNRSNAQHIHNHSEQLPMPNTNPTNPIPKCNPFNSITFKVLLYILQDALPKMPHQFDYLSTNTQNQCLGIGTSSNKIGSPGLSLDWFGTISSFGNAKFFSR